MGPVAKAALEDYESAPLDQRVREMLRFLSKMTLEPDKLEAADLEPLRAAGLSDAAIEEAIEVGFLFNVIDRIADAFDFHVSNEAELRWTVRILTRLGYKGTAR